MNIEAKAKALALQYHKHQKHGNDPYIKHLEGVASLVAEAGRDARTVALLHDIVEDTDMTLKGLITEGFPFQVIDAVDCLTHRKSQTYEAYIHRCGSHDLSRLVKIADLTYNLSDQQDPIRCTKYTLALMYLRML